MPMKSATKRERGLLVDLVRRADLDDAALVHDGEAARHGHRLLLVVRHHDEGEAKLLLQAHQLEARALAQLAVERGQRLVEQQELGPLDQRAGQRHALALAARELRRPAFAVVGQRTWSSASATRVAISAARQALAAQAVADVGRHVHVREEGVGLEHHVDRPAVRRHAGHVLAVDQDAARVGRLEARDHAQQRGLAAARAAQEGEQLAAPDVEIDAIDRGDRAEALGDPGDADDRRRRSSHRPVLPWSTAACARASARRCRR